VHRTPDPRQVHGHLVVYGSFDSAWSYLASRRVMALASTGVDVDWRAVEGDAPDVDDAGQRAERLQRVHEELELAAGSLLPDETLPSALAGFVPGTLAAVTAYAEAYRRGSAATIRPVLFEGLWLHGFDLADPHEVRTLLTDGMLAPPTEGDRWTTTTMSADRLRHQWASELAATRTLATPVLVIDGTPTAAGAVAVGWLGEALTRRHVDLAINPSAISK
jgi:2-hydroxychromene-2-carboxylate isomerase